MRRRDLAQRRARARRSPRAGRSCRSRASSDSAETSSGDPLVVDERPVEPRRLAVGQQVAEQVHLGIAGGEHRRRMPRHVEARQLDAILEHAAAARETARRGRDTGCGRTPGGKLAEVALGQVERPRRSRCRRPARATRSPGGSRSGRTPARPRAASRGCRRPTPIVIQ